MAQNKDGELGKHWVTYFDKIETRLSKALEKCEFPRKVKEKHPVKRIPREEQSGPSLRASHESPVVGQAGADREDANGLVEITKFEEGACGAKYDPPSVCIPKVCKKTPPSECNNFDDGCSAKVAKGRVLQASWFQPRLAVNYAGTGNFRFDPRKKAKAYCVDSDGTFRETKIFNI